MAFLAFASKDLVYPLPLAKSSALLLALAKFYLVSVALNNVAFGLSLFIIFLFFNGFFFYTSWALTFDLAGLTTFYTALELTILAISAFVKTCLFN